SVATLGGVGRLFRFGLGDGEVRPIDTPEGYPGVDGLLALGERTLVGFAGTPDVFHFAFSEDFDAVEVTALPEAAAWLDFPTTAARLGTRVYVVNSQLDHFVPGQPAFGTKPDLPFEIVGIRAPLLR
ncbi:MAG: hypothetical protein AAF602_30685, partial [Myxococcota bacterium]